MAQNIEKLGDNDLAKIDSFLTIGRAGEKEVLDRLGTPYSVYEQDRILIYHVRIVDDHRLSLSGSGPCHACVLVFDETDILSSYKIVRYGCYEM